MFSDVMDTALAEARAAAGRGEVPVGAVLFGPDGTVLARDGNRTRALSDPTAHAEMLVLRAGAALLGTERLGGCTLAVTLEPCAMCAGAIAHARIARLYFGAEDPKSGGVVHGPRVFAHATTHHRPEIYGGVREAACSGILRDFFRNLRF